ncbi:MAG: NAD-dependent deacylase [Caldilineales bacterium]
MADPSIRKVADLIRAARSVVVLTGAGVSTPSGIPDFRSPFSGLWNTFDPMEVASIWGFHDNPERFYRWFMPVARAIRTARPNAAHHALAALERAGRLDLLVTQNIDGLHQQAGSAAVVELHGDVRTARCLGCDWQAGSELLWARVERGEVLRCETCGSLLKPNAILFGEPLPYESLRRAQEAALRCDLMVAIGTSLEVEPASDLPYLARRRGSRVVIINRQPTLADSLAEVTIRGDIADVVPQLVEAVRL